MRTYAVLGAGVLALAAAACGTSTGTPSLRTSGRPAASPDNSIPPEFRHACGHPHAVIEVKRLPVTVSGASCDLVGVTVYFGAANAHVQPPGGQVTVYADGVKESPELTVSTAKNSDVSITGG